MKIIRVVVIAGVIASLLVPAAAAQRSLVIGDLFDDDLFDRDLRRIDDLDDFRDFDTLRLRDSDFFLLGDSRDDLRVDRSIRQDVDIDEDTVFSALVLGDDVDFADIRDVSYRRDIDFAFDRDFDIDDDDAFLALALGGSRGFGFSDRDLTLLADTRTRGSFTTDFDRDVRADPDDALLAVALDRNADFWDIASFDSSFTNERVLSRDVDFDRDDVFSALLFG